ncbi:hypothetical protein [Chryseobacterium sp. T1]
MNKIIFFLFLGACLSAQDFKKAEINLENGEHLIGEVFYNTPYYTPQSFVFRENKNSPEKKFNQNDIKSVLINDDIEYSKQIVSISRHKENEHLLENNDNYNLKNETLVLETLVKGTNSLYRYSDSQNTAYFYSVKGDSQIKPLLYKEYYNPNDESIKVKKSDFRNELTKINCGNNSINFVQYRESDLLNFFKKTNNCLGDTNQKVKSNYGSTNAKIAISKNFVSDEYKDYDTNQSYSFGLEIEKNLPFLNNQISIGLAGNYSTFNPNIEKTEVDKKSIKSQIDIGVLAYYYILNSPKHKVYLNAYIFDFSSSQYYTKTVFSGNPVVKEATHNLLVFNKIGAGYRYRNLEIFSLLYLHTGDIKSNIASIGLKYNFPNF